MLEQTRGLAVGDLDGDGLPDVVVASTDGDQITWFKNLGGQAFSDGTDIDSSADGAIAVQVADIDGDGYLDVISACTSGGAFSYCCGSPNLRLLNAVIDFQYTFVAQLHIMNLSPLTKDKALAVAMSFGRDPTVPG